MKDARYLFPSDYMADPSAHVFDGRLYIYPSHDWDSGEAFDDDGGHFQMRDYHALSFADIETGEATDHGVILSLEDIPWASRQLWDNDVVEYNGRYYMVFCAKDHTGTFRLGMATSDKPEGPFRPEAAPIKGSYSIDPCLFKDDDGEIYCYFGGLWGGQLQRYRDNLRLEKEYLPEGDEEALPARVVKMDMEAGQFAEQPCPVVVVDADGNALKAADPHRFFEASWLYKRDGLYHFVYSTGDSHLLCEATGTSPYGPFTFQRVILEPVVGWTTHASVCQFRGKWYLFHHDCGPSAGKTWLRSLKVREL